MIAGARWKAAGPKRQVYVTNGGEPLGSIKELNNGTFQANHLSTFRTKAEARRFVESDAARSLACSAGRDK